MGLHIFTSALSSTALSEVVQKVWGGQLESVAECALPMHGTRKYSERKCVSRRWHSSGCILRVDGREAQGRRIASPPPLYPRAQNDIVDRSFVSSTISNSCMFNQRGEYRGDGGGRGIVRAGDSGNSGDGDDRYKGSNNGLGRSTVGDWVSSGAAFTSEHPPQLAAKNILDYLKVQECIDRNRVLKMDTPYDEACN